MLEKKMPVLRVKKLGVKKIKKDFVIKNLCTKKILREENEIDQKIKNKLKKRWTKKVNLNISRKTE